MRSEIAPVCMCGLFAFHLQAKRLDVWPEFVAGDLALSEKPLFAELVCEHFV